jgi:hypothetical protein
MTFVHLSRADLSDSNNHNLYGHLWKINHCHWLNLRNWSSAIKTVILCNFLYHVTCQKIVIVMHSLPIMFSDRLKVSVCQCKSCQVMCCWYRVCICHFLLQMTLICEEILSVVCWTIRELKHTAIVDYLSLILFHFHFEGKMLKIQFSWKNCWPSRKSPSTGAVNVL